MKEEQILNSANILFSKYGFKKVSMDEIAKDAGVTKKTVYTYFSSKEELLKKLIKNELNQMKIDLEKSEETTGDFFESVHAGIYNLLKFRNKNNLFKMLFEEAEVLQNAQLVESLRLIEDDIMAYIKYRLKDAQEKKYIVVNNIDIMAFLIYKMYIALMIEWNDKYKSLNEKEIADNIMHIVKNGIERKDNND